ncbi:probable transcriptional regulator [Hahella chejuensis KCTC 2396]|uniref:Probable transcriptional regulator n=1 Tax=Hahella chejuensis (strain KCTC 2396) TaxID=349521 RepID=Q2SHD7_HAHCH|nr:winged helix-turn-helix domain-containing protein [Hahella chejuensis]ABC29937.1 probable transcriptional regulator [Hahella chejuensis KCTC 2396]
MTDRDYEEMQIGEWRINVETNRLYREAAEHQLSDKVCKVLLALAENPGRTVSRETLIQKVWNENEYVGEQALNTAIWQLRKAFNDSSEAPEYIETIPKKGYRLLKEVSVIPYAPRQDITPPPSAEPAPAPTPEPETSTPDNAPEPPPEPITEVTPYPHTMTPGAPPRRARSMMLGGALLLLAGTALIGKLMYGREDAPPAQAYWCGVDTGRMERLGIDPASACMLETEQGQFGLAIGERMAKINSSYYQSPDAGDIAGDIFFCESNHKRLGHKSNTLLSFVTLKNHCMTQRDGEVDIAERSGARASLVCAEYQPQSIHLQTPTAEKHCPLPPALTMNHPNAVKDPDYWYGVRRDELADFGIDEDASCTLNAEDPTWIDTIEFGWIWGARRCADSGSNPVGCGVVSHNAQRTGATVSDFFTQDQLHNHCAAGADKLALTPAGWWRPEHNDKTSLDAYLLCEQQQPKAIQLSFKPVVGAVVEKTCALYY